jgi:hypothetical protein
MVAGVTLKKTRSRIIIRNGLKISCTTSNNHDRIIAHGKGFTDRYSCNGKFISKSELIKKMDEAQ